MIWASFTGSRVCFLTHPMWFELTLVILADAEIVKSLSVESLLLNLEIARIA